MSNVNTMFRINGRIDLVKEIISKIDPNFSFRPNQPKYMSNINVKVFCSLDKTGQVKIADIKYNWDEYMRLGDPQNYMIKKENQ